MTSKQRQVTAIETAVLNAGVRQGYLAMSWVLEWGSVRALGELDSARHKTDRVLAVGRWYGYSDAKAWKRQKAFVTAFPNLMTPDELIDLPANVELRAFFDKAAKVSQRITAGAQLGRGMAVVTAAVVP